MNEQIVRLNVPPSLLDVPIINQLIRTYTDLTINILRAEISRSDGWLEVQFVGNPGMIEDAITWLQHKGVDVQTLGA